MDTLPVTKIDSLGDLGALHVASVSTDLAPTQKTPSVLPPKFIKVVITEDDRQQAHSYCSTGGCLIHTALTRIGFKEVSVGGSHVRIEGNDYSFDHNCGCATKLTKGNYDDKLRPHYDPLVVGMVIACTLVEKQAAGSNNRGAEAVSSQGQAIKEEAKV